MTALITTLPSAAESRAYSTMAIRQLSLASLPSKCLTTKIAVCQSGKHVFDAKVDVVKIDPDITGGYLPSKIWNTASDTILLYYVCESLPPQARPFASQTCYAIVLKDITVNQSIEYDATAIIFVDQLFNNSTDLPSYIFIFGEDQAKKMLSTDWDGNPWPYDLNKTPELELYVVLDDIVPFS